MMYNQEKNLRLKHIASSPDNVKCKQQVYINKHGKIKSRNILTVVENLLVTMIFVLSS